MKKYEACPINVNWSYEADKLNRVGICLNIHSAEYAYAVMVEPKLAVKLVKLTKRVSYMYGDKGAILGKLFETK